MKEIRIKQIRKKRRLARTRNKVLARRDLVRLTVFRSNNYIYAQIIDDKSGKTLVSASEKDVEASGNKTLKASEVGKKIAAAALKKKIKIVVFDRGGYNYHGRVKALADGAREGGLEF